MYPKSLSRQRSKRSSTCSIIHSMICSILTPTPPIPKGPKNSSEIRSSEALLGQHGPTHVGIFCQKIDPRRARIGRRGQREIKKTENGAKQRPNRQTWPQGGLGRNRSTGTRGLAAGRVAVATANIGKQ